MSTLSQSLEIMRFPVPFTVSPHVQNATIFRLFTVAKPIGIFVMGLAVATKAFFKLLLNRELSDSFQQLLAGQSQGKIETEVQSLRGEEAKPSGSTQPKPAPKPTRSDSISLLAALQREARFLDIVNEPLNEYSDAQVGAAARDVLQNSGKVIERMFAVEPLTETQDGDVMETPTSFEPSQFRLTGSVTGEAPFRGTVAHHGWKATRCEVPQWSGGSNSAMIIAPIELEIS